MNSIALNKRESGRDYGCFCPTRNSKKIFVDTCVIINLDSFLLFLTMILEHLKSKEVTLWIPRIVMHELKAVSNNPHKLKTTRISSIDCLKLLVIMHDKGFVNFFGDSDSIADNEFLKYAVAHQEPMTVITEDKNLRDDLLALKRLSCLSHIDVSIYKINGQGIPRIA